MAVVALPPNTQLWERPVPGIVERFLDRPGSGWNLSSIATALQAPRAAAEEPLALEHMRLAPPSGPGTFTAEVDVGGPLQFVSRPGDFDFEPGDE